MNLIIIFTYYFLLIPSIILLAFLTSIYLYWKFSIIIRDAHNDFDEDFNDSHIEDHACNETSVKNNESNSNQSSPSQSSVMPKIKNNRIVMTKEIDELLMKIVNNIVEYYIMSWYRPLIISPSTVSMKRLHQQQQSIEDFQNLLSNDIWLLVSCFIDRLYNVNHVQFISQQIVQCLRKHFQNVNSKNYNGNDCNDNCLDIPSKIGHRKNQHSISSLTTQLSDNNNDIDIDYDDNDGDSDISCSVSIKTESSENSVEKSKSKLSTFLKTQQQILLQNLNPFQNNELNQSSSMENNNNNNPPPPTTTTTATRSAIIYPLASHLFDIDLEKKLIKNLTNFIITTLFDDINRGFRNQYSSTSAESKLSTIQNSQTIRLFLIEILSKILFDMIDLITQPKIINYQIVKILKQYFLLKDLLFYDHFNNNNNLQVDNDDENSFDDNDSSSSDESNGNDDDDNNDDNYYEYFGRKKNVFILNEAKQCIQNNDFDHLYELIDKCNNIKLLKHIRLKLIAEILDAAVVSQIDNDKQRHTQLYSKTSSNSSEKNDNFCFHGQINLKFKKFKQEKNIKRLIVRLRFAKTLCEQKIQIRKRTLAELLPKHQDEQYVDGPVSDSDFLKQENKANHDKQKQQQQIKEQRRFSFDNLSIPSDIIRSNSLDDSLLQSSFNDNDDDQDKPQQQHQQPRMKRNREPSHKKIFKFHQIMLNKNFREYFKTFLQQSLLQTDPATTKRSSLMKFRKDVLLVDCTVYLLEFWENLQTIFENFLLWAQFKNDDDEDNDNNCLKILHDAFEKSFKQIFILIIDQRFSYTFSRQFLSLSPELMMSLERFLLGDIEIDSIDLSGENFNLYQNDDEISLLKTFHYADQMSKSFYLHKRIDWYHYLDILVKLEKILFDCFHQEFYPQFLISQQYDQLLTEYFEKRQTNPKMYTDYGNELPREQWCNRRYQDNNNENNNIRLNQALRFRPLNKIMLKSSSNYKKIEKKIIDLNKNRRMLFNSIEFPFCYLSTVKLLLIIRLRLKCWIKNIINNMNDSERYESSANQIYGDLFRIISSDIEKLKNSIDRLHRILTRSFCWLNADFSCVITECRYRNDYEQILQSSTANTTESKIMSFVENLFVNNLNDKKFKSTSALSVKTTTTSSNPNVNLLFQLNITALLSRFQYNYDYNQMKKLLLPTNVRNDMMSNWSYQWSVELSFEQLQQFYLQSIRSFLRFIIYLNRFKLHNYLTVINDHLQQRHTGDNGKIVDTFSTSTPSKMMNSSEIRNNFTIRFANKNVLNSEQKILQKFLQSTNQILNEIRQLNRSMVSRLKQQQQQQQQPKNFFKNIIKSQNDQSENQTISFKKLLNDHDELDVGFDAFELLGDRTVTPENDKKYSPIDHLMKRAEKLFNILFQQITAQELVVKSTSFLNLIGYDEIIKSKMKFVDPQHCLRCYLFEYLFETNDDDANLNHLVQIYLFNMLFDYDPVLIGHLVTNMDFQAQQINDNDNNNNTNDDDQDNYENTLKNDDDNDNDDDTIIDKYSLTSRLFFAQIRSLLMEKTSKHCFDYCLQQLYKFNKYTDNEINVTKFLLCQQCYKNNIISLSAANATTTNNNNDGDNQMLSSSSSISSLSTKNRKQFRLFNVHLLEQNNNGHDDCQSASISSSTNILDIVLNNSVVNVNNIFLNIFRQQQQQQLSSSSMTNNMDKILNNTIMNDDDYYYDETPLLLMSLDETQLFEPFFQLLIDIFELKGNTVTRTLRRLLMFVMRLFIIGSAKISRPYKQFLESLFTEQNVFRLLSMINVHLETMLKNSLKQTSSSSITTMRTQSMMNGKLKNNRQRPTNNEKIDETNQIDIYLEELNHLLCSLENDQTLAATTATTPATPTTFTAFEEFVIDNNNENNNYINNNDNYVDNDCAKQFNSSNFHQSNETISSKLQPQQSSEIFPSIHVSNEHSDDTNDYNNKPGQHQIKLQTKSSSATAPTTTTSSSVVEDPEESIKERKLQILAKQLLFAATPTIINHLIGQENIDRGLNKCYDILQYQKLNKHLIYEFIEAFMLEYFPEFRKLSSSSSSSPSSSSSFTNKND